MHCLARNTLVRLTALVAALAFAGLPAELLAGCGCNDCVCPAAAGDAVSCCCTGTAMQAPGCCHSKSPAAPNLGGSANPTADCTCQQTIPLQPAGTQVSLEESRRGEPVVLPALFTHVSLDEAFRVPGLLAARDHRAFPVVPIRVMFCVWRN